MVTGIQGESQKYNKIIIIKVYNNFQYHPVSQKLRGLWKMCWGHILAANTAKIALKRSEIPRKSFESGIP